MKARFVNQSRLVGAVETVGIGGIAAVLAYGAGVLLKGLVE